MSELVKTAKMVRAEKLSAALKENLRRRKAQSRGRDAAAKAESGAGVAAAKMPISSPANAQEYE